MIIGLSGKKRVGKDTVADYLVSKYGFIKYSFADPIKEVAKILFEFSENQLYGDKKEEIDLRWNISPRDFFQKFGTDYMQYQFPKDFPKSNEVINDKCFWVKRFHIWYLAQKKKNPDIKIVITDVRFEHEYDYLIDEDAMIIKITKDKVDNNDTHISETELNSYDISKFDYHIKNNETIGILHMIIDDIMDYERI
jgi:hypothetical protein